MSYDLTISGSINDEEDDEMFAVDSVTVTRSGNRKTENVQSIGTSEEALQLGELSGADLGYALFKNLDTTNYLEIRSGTGAGNDIIKVGPGKIALFEFGSDVSAPYAIANTAACRLKYKIWEA